MGDVDELLCAGDSIYEYRFSNEVVELLRERRARYVLGNHESVFLGPQGARARGAANVRHDLVEYVASQPLSYDVDVGGKRLVMVHATPFEPLPGLRLPGSPGCSVSPASRPTIILGHARR
jgi:hypothetical protein